MYDSLWLEDDDPLLGWRCWPLTPTPIHQLMKISPWEVGCQHGPGGAGDPGGGGWWISWWISWWLLWVVEISVSWADVWNKLVIQRFLWTMGFLKNEVSRLSENEHCWIWRVLIGELILLIFGWEVPCGKKKGIGMIKKHQLKKIGRPYHLRWMEREGKHTNIRSGREFLFLLFFFSNIYIYISNRL